MNIYIERDGVLYNINRRIYDKEIISIHIYKDDLFTIT